MTRYRISKDNFLLLEYIVSQARLRSFVGDIELAKFFPHGSISLNCSKDTNRIWIIVHLSTKKIEGYINKFPEIEGEEKPYYMNQKDDEHYNFLLRKYRWYPLEPEEILLIKCLERE